MGKIILFYIFIFVGGIKIEIAVFCIIDFSAVSFW
jgi:hypothetical protein